MGHIDHHACVLPALTDLSEHTRRRVTRGNICIVFPDADLSFLFQQQRLQSRLQTTEAAAPPARPGRPALCVCWPSTSALITTVMACTAGVGGGLRGMRLGVWLVQIFYAPWRPTFSLFNPVPVNPSVLLLVPVPFCDSLPPSPPPSIFISLWFLISVAPCDVRLSLKKPRTRF